MAGKWAYRWFIVFGLTCGLVWAFAKIPLVGRALTDRRGPTMGGLYQECPVEEFASPLPAKARYPAYADLDEADVLFVGDSFSVHPDLPPAPSLGRDDVSVDLDDGEYAAVVRDLKEHILDGDVFQIVPSRTFTAPCREEPLAVYRRLRKLNPSPYMFFVRMEGQTLLAASPETALKVSADGKVEIRPIAGTRPRGLIDGKVDVDLDGRYEAELKLDEKELAEHVMLVDLARNDVARVSKPRTREVPRLFEVEKYSHVQHLVSCVSGQLKEGLDPLHAYVATMNMGTLTGAPKVEAMRLLRQTEATRRGYYGGAAGYYMLNGDFDSAIVIRSLLLTGDVAIARAGAGVVYDSIPEAEAEETRNKARAPLAALGLDEERR